jgi:hypothetical protein
VNFETNKILAERYLGMATHEDYVDWAVACLDAELDTKNIRILASLRNASSPSEVEDYFNRCLNDLGLTMPDSEECLMEYARGVAQQILSVDILPLDGCRKIYDIAAALGFPGDMIAWLYLDEGLHPDGLRDLQGADWDEAIKSEAALFLEDNSALKN